LGIFLIALSKEDLINARGKMKIMLISSSPHKEKSQTFLLAKEVLKGCSDSVKTEVIHLCDFKIR